MLDYIGIGVGPSNIAVAVAAAEQPIPLRGLFFEAKPEVQWHPGMILDGSRMQVSFLKDLVTLRDPSSRFTFLQYLKSKGRLERFVNLRQFYPTRVEYQDYLRWVAGAFADQMRYSSAVRNVGIVADEQSPRQFNFVVTVEHLVTGEVRSYRARNVLHAAGGRPNLRGLGTRRSSRIMHSSDFLMRFPEHFPDRNGKYRVVVAGGGQSAGEIVEHLHGKYPSSLITIVIPHGSIRPSDNSHFVNETFFAAATDRFYGAGDAERAHMLREARNTNYGVMDADLIRSLYSSMYLDEVKGSKRIEILEHHRVQGAEDLDGTVRVTLADGAGRSERRVCDAFVMATGYHREFDRELFAEIVPHVVFTESGRPALSRTYEVSLTVDMAGSLYVQGCGEASHGIGDSLLSLLPFRSEEIVQSMCRRIASEGARSPETVPGDETALAQ
jgi:lysine/ornithine N-monooxygenase